MSANRARRQAVGKVEKQVPVCIRRCTVSKSTTQNVIELRCRPPACLSDILISGRQGWDRLIEPVRQHSARPRRIAPLRKVANAELDLHLSLGDLKDVSRDVADVLGSC